MRSGLARTLSGPFAPTEGIHAVDYDITVYGRGSIGTTDSGAGLATAYADAVSQGVPLILPAGIIRYGSMPFEIDTPVPIIGQGKRSTFLSPLSSYTGWFAEVYECWRGGAEQPNDTLFEIANDNAGATFCGFSVYGDRATNANGVKFTGRNDDILMRDVQFSHLAGTALGIASEDASGVSRESEFHSVHVISCGSSTEAAVEVACGASALDGTNHLTFHNFKIGYSHGRALHVWNDNASLPIRRLLFSSLMLHGSQQQTSPPVDDVSVIEGDVRDTSFYGIKGNGSMADGATKYAIMRLRADAASKYPVGFMLDGGFYSNSDGDGLVVEKADHLDVRVRHGVLAGDSVKFLANSVPTKALVDTVGTGTVSIDATVTGVVTAR